VVVNLQGDEPAMPATLIDQCAALLDDHAVDIATLASPIGSRSDFENPNVVKVITNDDGDAIYFSRAPIPYDRSAGEPSEAMSAALHHHGIYAYRAGKLREMVAGQPTELELCERLEQIRALSLGMVIRVAMPIVRPGSGVDTEADLIAVGRDLSGLG
jgi:3-deoxy-manno-octulosonate cytidylyltransferase (CMP-KDO synthetase)